MLQEKEILSKVKYCLQDARTWLKFHRLTIFLAIIIDYICYYSKPINEVR